MKTTHPCLPTRTTCRTWTVPMTCLMPPLPPIQVCSTFSFNFVFVILFWMITHFSFVNLLQSAHTQLANEEVLERPSKQNNWKLWKPLSTRLQSHPDILAKLLHLKRDWACVSFRSVFFLPPLGFRFRINILADFGSTVCVPKPGFSSIIDNQTYKMSSRSKKLTVLYSVQTVLQTSQKLRLIRFRKLCLLSLSLSDVWTRSVPVWS